MPDKNDHPCFTPPKDKDIKIWRYMDFTKLVSLLDTECLFLSRVDMHEDPYEGAISHANTDIRELIYKNSGIEISRRSLKQISEYREWSRSWTYINCWHMNNFESYAMWKMYTQTSEAVVIQSTYSKLRENLPDKVYVGVVNYIDYDKDWLPEDNGYWPFVHKRLSFEHEKELRVLVKKHPKPNAKGKKYFDFIHSQNELGISIKINIEDIIENIYVAPTAPSWFFQTVSNVTKRYGYNIEVKQSSLTKKPVF